MCKIHIYNLKENTKQFLELKKEISNYFYEQNRPLPKLKIGDINQYIHIKNVVNLIYDNDNLTEQHIVNIKKQNQIKCLIFISINQQKIEELQEGKFEHLIIIKDCSKKSIEKAMNKVTQVFLNEKMVLKIKGGEVMINKEELNYINIENRVLAYHLDNECLYSKTLQSSFMKEIPNIANKPEMMLVGKNLLINLTKIKKINDEEITFMNKDKLYIPKVRKDEVITAWKEYFLE